MGGQGLDRKNYRKLGPKMKNSVLNGTVVYILMNESLGVAFQRLESKRLGRLDVVGSVKDLLFS